jgi:hypothetical protein
MGFAGSLAMALFPLACAGPSGPSGGAGGSSGGSGGSSGGSATGGKSGTGGNSSSGGSSGAGGATSSGGSGQPDAPIASGGAGGSGGSTTNAGGTGGSGGSGGVTATGGAAGTGGSSAPRGSGGVGGTTSGTGGTTGGAGGTAGTSSGSGGTTGTGGTSVSTFNYKLPPPDRCHDQDFIPYDYNAKTGCKDGDATTDCGGKCTVANACTDPPGSKNGDYTFMCQRNQLFSAEMEAAAAEDGNTGFHYAVVGHDVGDPGGIDGNAQSACCQCYQLVYAYPSPNNDRQAQLNPDNPNPPASGVQVPPPLIAQAFNTGATPTTFDVYMPAGGLGANNACAQVAGAKSQSGLYMYTSYPADGQPSQGGVKPSSLYQECKTAVNWVTSATLSSAACQQKTAAACNQIASNIPGLTKQSQSGCIKGNTIDTLYHLNWSVYVAKVECPENLTRVTGCKLAPQGLPAVKKDVTTAAQAAKDPDFRSKTGGSNNMYETTTMEDCCRPSCSSITWTTQKGLVTDPQYRAFYLCNANGVPYTQ